MDYGIHFSANQLGGPKKVWGIREYGLLELWVKRVLTVDLKAPKFLSKPFSPIFIPFLQKSQKKKNYPSRPEGFGEKKSRFFIMRDHALMIMVYS